MMQRLALVALTALSLLAVLLFLVDLPWSKVLFAGVAAVFPPTLMVIGAARRGRLGLQLVPIALLAATLLAVMAGLFVYRGDGLDGRWWGGLPMAAAIQLYGLFLLPLAMSSLGYAVVFDHWGLSQEDLDDLRARFPTTIEVDATRPAGARVVRSLGRSAIGDSAGAPAGGDAASANRASADAASAGPASAGPVSAGPDCDPPRNGR